MQDVPMTQAASLLNINYSTAKTILRIFRKEKRIEKKNAQQERELKKFIVNMKDKSNENPNKPKTEEKNPFIIKKEGKRLFF